MENVECFFGVLLIKTDTIAGNSADLNCSRLALTSVLRLKA